MDKKEPWNSLEIAKLTVSLLTPLVVGAIGYWVQSTIAEQGQTWKVSERLIDRRLAVYDEVRVKINRIYCFVEDVGTWKEDTPESITKLRREVHTAMHTNRALWSPSTFSIYLEYMDRVAFVAYAGGIGGDAVIRTMKNEKEKGIVGWKSEWNMLITDERDPGHKKNYSALQDLIATDLRLNSPGTTNLSHQLTLFVNR